MDEPLATSTHCGLFIVASNNRVVPKERRIERLPSGYSVRERSDAAEGSYWVVVSALEVA